MDELMKLCFKAYKKDEVPVGAFIKYNNKIISKAYNTREKSNDITNHAEIIAIRKASKKLHTWKLNECELYVSLKPCKMCEEVIKQSRIKSVQYIIDKPDFKRDFDKTIFTKIDDQFTESNYKDLLNKFFKNKR